MQSHALSYDLTSSKWAESLPALDSPRTLVLGFGAPEMIDSPAAFGELAKQYPRSLVIGCSSAGEIHGTTVRDHSLSVTVTKFDKTDLQLASLEVRSAADSFTAGSQLAKRLATKPGLRGVLILSEGLHVNGSELIRGLNDVLDDGVVVTGGLSGDGAAFKRTWVAIGGKLRSDVVAAVGFYGDHVVIGHGSKGGWDKFGPERIVTKADANVLYELDGRPALQLYKEYLGDKAKDLPGSGLLFPLSIRSSKEDDRVIVRTVLAVDHEKNSLTFAGDIPKGSLAQLMKADFDRIIDASGVAGSMTMETGAPAADADALIVAISCVGRRLVLGARIEEEVEAVREVFPSDRAKITGFYSYGEISPYTTGHCDLHNQTMTLTSFSESATPLAKPKLAARGSGPIPVSFEDTNTEMQVPIRAGFAVSQLSYDHSDKTWSAKFPELDSPRTLVLGFGAPELADDPAPFIQLAQAYPKSLVIGCSSAGEIHGTDVRDHSVAVAITRFDKTDLQLVSLDVSSGDASRAAGSQLAKRLATKPGLRGVLILSEGLHVNGSELIRGFNDVLDDSIVVTGGLSGDGAAFKRTWVAIGGKLKSDVVAAVGFYGDHIVIGHGSKGGWDKFGPERVVTRSESNVLYELDGRPALQLYKEYLGDKAKDLPGSGLLFPLQIRSSSTDDKPVVRTLLAVDHEKSSLTFAGDLPKGSLAQLMKADFDRLIDGAGVAATTTVESAAQLADSDALVVAISCVGRRLVLGARIEEEVEAVRDALRSDKAKITGFYSYGEISPYATGHSELHNQTMTLTMFAESPTPVARPKLAARGSKPAITATLTSTPSPIARPPAPTKPPAVTRTNGTSQPPPIAIPSRPAAAPTTPMPASTTTQTGMPIVPRSAIPAKAVAPPKGPVVRLPRAIGSDAVVETTTIGNLQLVKVHGRLTEAFKGDALGRTLVGRVVFDLGEVDRVTSFGVREWLAMMSAARMTECHFIRCSESIVNQLAMIRKFDGNARIVSFFAPYLCTSCGSPAERLLDCERDAGELATMAPAPIACPRCENEARFDDDPRSYFSFAAASIGSTFPADVRALHDSLLAQVSAPAVEEIEKSVDGDATRIRVHGKLSSQLRWRRILDGIEGELIVDLEEIPAADPAGVNNLDQALRALPPAVTPIEIEHAPSALVERLLDIVPRRLRIASAVVSGYCPSCAVHRPASVRIDRYVADVAAGREHQVVCKRCNGNLQLAVDATFERLCALQAPTRSQPIAPIVVAPVAPMLPPARTGVAWTTVATTFAVIVAVGAVIVAMSRHSEPAVTPPPPAPIAAVASPVVPAVAPATWEGKADLPPAWTERPFAVEGDTVFVVGHGTPTANAEQSLDSARRDATARLVDQLYSDLAGSPVHDFLEKRIRRDEPGATQAVAARFEAQHGRDIAFERADVATRKRDAGTEVYVRYKLDKKQYDGLVQTYRSTQKFRGADVAQFFPLLDTAVHAQGQLVVIDVEKRTAADLAGIHEGDVLDKVGATPVATVDAFRQASMMTWANLGPRERMTLELESAGAARTVAMFKPAPPQP